MGKLTVKQFEARVKNRREGFFKLWNVFEMLNQKYDVVKIYKNISLDEIETAYKELPTAPDLKKTFRSQKRYDGLIFQLACVSKVFSIFGPGKGEVAWSYLVELGRSHLLGGAE